MMLAGCAAATQSRGFGDLPREEVVTRYARLLAMADARRVDTMVIDAALASRVPQLRAAAARAIGQLGQSALAPRLRILLRDPDTLVAANAGFALGLLDDSASVAALVDALTASPTVAVEAAWALGEVGEPARTAITYALSVPPPADAVRGELLLAAAKLRPVPVGAIVPWLTDPGRDVAWRAAYAIARSRARGGVRHLLAHALHPDQLLRAQVARGLAHEAAGDSLAEQAIARLDLLAADREPHVRINAIRSYATYGEPARLAVLASLRDQDANVRIAAAGVVGDVMDRDLARWAWIWDSDTTLAFRSAVLRASVQAGVLLPELHGWRDEIDWRLRAAAASAAGAARDAEHLERLAFPLISDWDARVREAAYAAIGTYADSSAHPAFRRALLDALDDRDFYVRATALSALASGANGSEVPRALDSYRMATVDSLNDARIAAMRFVAAAWTSDSSAFTPAMRSRLAGLATPDDPLVRLAGQAITPLAHWPGAADRAQPLSWYIDIIRTIAYRPDSALSPPAPLSAVIITSRGTLELELFGADAPLTVHNFMTLARSGFYRGTRFHRVVPNFVAQDGDPRGDGNGGPGYSIRDELNRHRYHRGALGMALSGPDTGGSQYFITHSPQPHLDGGYTVFGRLRSGCETLDAIVQGDGIQHIIIP